MTTATINFVWTWASLLSGELDTCLTWDDASCEGGIAAVRAHLRYYEEVWRQEQRDRTSGGQDDDDDPEQSSLIIPRLDYQSAFAQMHELRWAVNRVVFQNRFGWEAFFAYPSLVSQDQSQLQTLGLKPLMSNVQVPSSNPWFPYIENIHFDAKTGLAVLAFDTPDQKYVSQGNEPIASAKALLSFVAARNAGLPGCSRHNNNNNNNNNEVATNATTTNAEQSTTYEQFLRDNGLNATFPDSVVKPPHCWIPLVVYEEAKPNGFRDFVEAMRNHPNPPALIVDVRGNNATATDDPNVFIPNTGFVSSHVVEDTGIWVVSYMYYYLLYDQQRLIVSTDPDSYGRVLNVTLIEDSMFGLRDEIKDDEFRADLSFIRGLAEQAADNDPVAGPSEFMPPGEIEAISLRPCMGGECPIGNLFSDAIRWRKQTDISFIQSGGVRGKGWPAGDVKMSNIWQSLPFPNTLCTGNITGVSLFRLFNHSTSKSVFDSTWSVHGDKLLQVSGMRYTYNTELPDSGRLVGMEILNRTTNTYEPVKRLGVYTFTTDSYMCSGADLIPELLGAQSLKIKGNIPEHVSEGDFIGRYIQESPASIDEEGLIQNDVFDFLSYLKELGLPYDTSIQGRLSNDTSKLAPLNWIQTEHSCAAGTYWIEELVTCFSCPNTGDVTFLDKRIDFGKVLTGSPIQITRTAKITNKGDVDIDIELKSNPDWIDFIGVRIYDANGNKLESEDLLIESEQQVKIGSRGAIEMDIIASADKLEAGTALGAVSFAVLYGSGNYNGCVGRDATFDTFMEVTRVPTLNTPGSVKAAGLSLMAVSMLTAIGFAAWVAKKRNHAIIKAMQPVFMIGICAGSFIIALVILPLTIEDDLVSAEDVEVGDTIPNGSCMAAPWLLSMGFTVVMSSLGAKLWRINKIFNGGRLRQTVTAKEALANAGVLFGLNFVILVAWQIKSPRQYVIRSGEEEWDLYGVCTSTDTAGKVFGGLTVALNVGALLATSHQAWKARNISSDFSESKDVGMALFCWVELLLVGVPVLFLMKNDNANAYYFLQISLVFAITMTMLLIIFLPLIFHVREYNKTRQEGMRRSSSIRISGLNNLGTSTSSLFSGFPDTESPQQSRNYVPTTLANASLSNRTKPPLSTSAVLENDSSFNDVRYSKSESTSSNRSAGVSLPLDDSSRKKLQQIMETANDEEIARKPDPKDDPDPSDAVISENPSPDIESEGNEK